MVAAVSVGDDFAEREHKRSERERLDNEHLAPIDASMLDVADINDLRFFWHDAEAECGVRSNFGAMCEAVQTYGAAAHVAAKEGARVRAAAKRALAKKAERIKDSARERERIALLQKAQALAEQTHGVHVDIDYGAALDSITTEYLSRDERLELELHDTLRIDGRLTATGHVSHVTHWEDPFTDAQVGFPRRDKTTGELYRNPREGTIAKCNRIRATLKRAGVDHTLVLFAVYGPPRGDALTSALRKRFGDLAEIVVTVARATSDGGDARFIALSRSTDASFVRMQKKNAERLILDAGNAYVRAKS